jgi:hypothetical protein
MNSPLHFLDLSQWKLAKRIAISTQSSGTRTWGQVAMVASIPLN